MKQWREQELLNQLRLRGKMDLKEVMDLLQISESTTRRLFTKLEEEEKVVRVLGGIQIVQPGFLEYSFEGVAQKNTKEKTAIAKRAVELLKDGDIIFCDSGTTVLTFCLEIVQRMRRKEFDLQVYTNSLVTLEALAPHVPVILLGGKYRGNRKDFCGYFAESMLSRLHMTKCFLGVDGCDLKKYFTTTDFETAKLDEIAIENSEKTIILADSSKFYSYAPIGYASFDYISTVVTDVKLDKKVKQELERFNMEIIRA